MDEFYTEKEFNEIRENIVKLFEGDLSKYFSVKKSTYKWSSKNNWNIHVEVSKQWGALRNNPKGTLDAVSLLFKTVSDFIENEENKFFFKSVGSRSDFGFIFTFQPIVMVAKGLLNK